MSTLRRGTVALAAATFLGLGTTTAEADPGIPNVGYGYPNYGQSVYCVQYLVNFYTGMHIAEDGKFGPQTQSGIKRLQELSNRQWATQELVVDGVFGKTTGEVVLRHAKNDPSISYQKAFDCSHRLPSHTVIF